MNRLENRLEEIKKGLPLIPKNIPIKEQIAMAKKKLIFMNQNSNYFISTGEYMMTISSVREEIKQLKDVEQKDGE